MEKVDRLLDWKPQPERPFDLGQTAAENKAGLQALGAAIADAILPVLTPEDVTSDLANRIFKRKEDALSIVQAYPELLRLLPLEGDRAVKGIIRAMISRDSDEAWAAFNTLYRWLRGAERGYFAAVPRRRIEITLSVAETRREPGLLHALNLATHLVDNGLLSDSDKDRLASTLGLISIETSYGAAQSSKEIGITSLTLVRATAVRLAHSLAESCVRHPDVETWLSGASTDPMPEVRFAVDTPFE
jgi:hypothetical protein